jgi:hypothetical protein
MAHSVVVAAKMLRQPRTTKIRDVGMHSLKGERTLCLSPGPAVLALIKSIRQTRLSPAVNPPEHEIVVMVVARKTLSE